MNASGPREAAVAVETLRACRARDTEVEGIEMILVLDDLTGPPAGEPAAREVAEGARLAALGRRYCQELSGAPDVPDEHRVLLDAIEVLAARHFEPGAGA